MISAKLAHGLNMLGAKSIFSQKPDSVISERANHIAEAIWELMARHYFSKTYTNLINTLSEKCVQNIKIFYRNVDTGFI